MDNFREIGNHFKKDFGDLTQEIKKKKFKCVFS